MSLDSLDQQLLGANAAFYRALRDKDLAALERIWAREVPVACVHPGMDALEGRAAVMASWRGILRHPRAPTLDCTRPRAHVLGTTGFVTCLEGAAGKPPRLVAVNVFVMEDGHWRLASHQSGPLSPRKEDRDAIPKAMGEA